MILIVFAFLAGLVTILAPCMWPMLPIVLSSTVKGKDHKRPLGITIGVMTSFAVFTLSVSYLVRAFHFDPNILRIFAVVVIIFLGLTLIIPALSQIIEGSVSRLTGIIGIQKQQQGNDFKSGFLTGLMLGVIWSPCGGPILASIATLAATGMVNIQVILVTLFYVAGVGLPLFIFTYGGQQVITKTRFISAYTGRVQQIFGIIMILTAVAIFFNYDKLLQLKILEAFPAIGQGLNGFEKSSVVTKQLDTLKGKLSANVPDTNGLLNTNYSAPEFFGITKWLNSPRFGEAGTDHPLTMKELRGKVVLVDFWTYTCINCIRTLPYVTSWYDKYKDQGFVVVGVHTPEFAFEKDTNNVVMSIKQYNIHYPVGQDNNYETWNAYNNQYWPAEYLIDANGIVRRTHFGEGKYDETEMAIQLLLKERGKVINKGLVTIQDQTPTEQLTPETYLGLKRMDRFSSSEQIERGIQTFSASKEIPLHYFALSGTWDEQEEYAQAKQGSSLTLHFVADKVFLVITPKTNTDHIAVFLDGGEVDAAHAGQDVVAGVVAVTVPRLYNLIDLHGKTEEHTLELRFQTEGTEVFAFTFG